MPKNIFSGQSIDLPILKKSNPQNRLSHAGKIPQDMRSIRNRFKRQKRSQKVLLPHDLPAKNSLDLGPQQISQNIMINTVSHQNNHLDEGVPIESTIGFEPEMDSLDLAHLYQLDQSQSKVPVKLNYHGLPVVDSPLRNRPSIQDKVVLPKKSKYFQEFVELKNSERNSVAHSSVRLQSKSAVSLEDDEKSIRVNTKPIMKSKSISIKASQKDLKAKDFIKTLKPILKLNFKLNLQEFEDYYNSKSEISLGSNMSVGSLESRGMSETFIKEDSSLECSLIEREIDGVQMEKEESYHTREGSSEGELTDSEEEESVDYEEEGLPVNYEGESGESRESRGSRGTESSRHSEPGSREGETKDIVELEFPRRESEPFRFISMNEDLNYSQDSESVNSHINWVIQKGRFVRSEQVSMEKPRRKSKLHRKFQIYDSDLTPSQIKPDEGPKMAKVVNSQELELEEEGIPEGEEPDEQSQSEDYEEMNQVNIFKEDLQTRELPEQNEAENLGDSNYDTNYMLLKETQKINDISQIIERESFEKRKESLEYAASEYEEDSLGSEKNTMDNEMKNLENYLKSEMDRTDELHIELKVDESSDHVQTSRQEIISKGTSYNSFKMLNSDGALSVSDNLSERICQNEGMIEESNLIISQIMNTLKQDLKHLEKRQGLPEEEYQVNGEHEAKGEHDWLPNKNLTQDLLASERVICVTKQEDKDKEFLKSMNELYNEIELSKLNADPEEDQNLILSQSFDSEKGQNEEAPQEELGSKIDLDYLNKKLKRLQKLEFRRVRKIKDRRKAKTKMKRRAGRNASGTKEDIEEPRPTQKEPAPLIEANVSISSKPLNDNLKISIPIINNKDKVDIGKFSESSPVALKKDEKLVFPGKKSLEGLPKLDLKEKDDYELTLDDENLQLILKLNKESMFLLQSGNFQEISKQVEFVKHLRESITNKTELENIVRQSIQEVKGIWKTITRTEKSPDISKIHNFFDDKEEEIRKLILDRRVQTGEQLGNNEEEVNFAFNEEQQERSVTVLEELMSISQNIKENSLLQLSSEDSVVDTDHQINDESLLKEQELYPVIQKEKKISTKPKIKIEREYNYVTVDKTIQERSFIKRPKQNPKVELEVDVEEEVEDVQIKNPFIMEIENKDSTIHEERLKPIMHLENQKLNIQLKKEKLEKPFQQIKAIVPIKISSSKPKIPVKACIKPPDIQKNLSKLKQKSKKRKLQKEKKKKIELEQTIRIEELKELMGDLPKDSENIIDYLSQTKSVESLPDNSFEINENRLRNDNFPLIKTKVSEKKRDLDLKRVNNKLVKEKIKPIEEDSDVKEKSQHFRASKKRYPPVHDSFTKHTRRQTELPPKSNYRKLFYEVETPETRISKEMSLVMSEK